MKYILRNTGTKVINLPSEIWKKAGWKLNDEVEVVVCVNHTCNEDNDKWDSISIDRVKDLIKYDEDYTYNIYAYVLVLGKKYNFSDLRLTREIGSTDFTVGPYEATACLEFYDPTTGDPATANSITPLSSFSFML